MYDPEKIENFDEEFAGLMSKVEDSMMDIMSRSERPHTVYGMLSLLASGDSLKLGILDLARSENLYGTSALFRSLIEHYLRFQYLWFRLIEANTDEPGREYKRFSELSETLELGEAFKFAALVKGKDLSHLEVLQMLKERNPDLGELTKGQIRQITAQWRYRSIIRYVSERLNSTSEDGPPMFLSTLIPVYAELSSYVHGGFAAGKQASSLTNEGTDADLAWSHAHWACILANAVKLQFLMILLNTEPTLTKNIGELNACLREYMNASDEDGS